MIILLLFSPPFMSNSLQPHGLQHSRLPCPSLSPGVWVNSRSWWWTGKPGMLQSMGSQRVGHEWATELNWRGSLAQKKKKMQQDNPRFSMLCPWLAPLFPSGPSQCPSHMESWTSPTHPPLGLCTAISTLPCSLILLILQESVPTYCRRIFVFW